MSSTKDPDLVRRWEQRKKEAGERESEERDAQKWRKGLAVFRALLKEIIAQRRAQETANRENEAQENKLVAPAWSGAHAGRAAAVLAFLSLGAFVFLGIRADETAKRAGDAARSAATAEQKTADIADATNRAWVAPKGMEFIGAFEAGKAAPFLIYYDNVGHGPALGVNLNVLIFTDADNSSNSTAPIESSGDNACVGVMPENGREVAYPNGGDMRAGKSIPAERMTSEVITGTRYLLIEGCFVYRSIGPKIHHSKFCLIAVRKGIKATPQATPLCSTGNDAD